MSLFVFAVACLAGQLVAANFSFNVISSEPVSYLLMGISAHMVISLLNYSSLERCRGFFVFFMAYAMAELYLFSMAIVCAVDALYPIYSILYDRGPQTMAMLTAISLLAPAIPAILNKTGKVGDLIGRFIDRCHSVVMRLPHY